jgi:caffeoyl-CoA O-methyltransferase
MDHRYGISLLACLAFMSALSVLTFSGPPEKDNALDKRVKTFLEKTKYEWRDMNVPETDGKLLYNIVLEHNYKRALELGTSTGRSAIYIAWALSKTGGKLITVEIDEGRYREALANFKEAGLEAYIDARLADAHQLVKDIPGPFDFVFIDADKGWYTNYAKALIPKLEASGCIAAHNVYASGSGRGWGMGRGYYDYITSLPEFETRVLPESQAGLAVSYRKDN